MIIISNKPGQLGNLLFIYANLLAYGTENNIRVFNPSFYQYQRYFETTSKRSYFFYSLCYKFVFVIARVFDKLKMKFPFIYVKCLSSNEIFDLDIANESLNSKMFCFLQGWLYRSDKLLIKHAALIKAFFTPIPELNSKIDIFFKNKFDLTNETVIAIHIRRGDYSNFEYGKYYYELFEYKKIINDISILFNNQNLHFLICSNEQINLDDINTNNHKMTLAPNHELLDMYCMTRCNYIVGPPSTYTMWASFYGNVPLCMIKDKNKTITLTDFKI